MADSVTRYQSALLALLPRGAAWNKDPDSELGKLMAGIAIEFARIDQRAADLLNESHPSSTNELFNEWEAMYGLPDACAGDSFQERLSALIQTYRMQGGQSRAFFIEVAALMGYDITITEYKQRRFGSLFGELYGGLDWAFVWQVNASSINYKQHSFGEPFGEVYRTWSNARLECVFNRLKHSHRHIIFSYT